MGGRTQGGSINDPLGQEREVEEWVAEPNTLLPKTLTRTVPFFRGVLGCKSRKLTK